MGYQVLVTLDLPGATEDQRNTFYEVLRNEQWIKIPKLTTAWKVSFQDGGNRDNTIRVIRSDIKKAKDTSKVKIVEYAFQLDLLPVIIENQ